MEQLSEQVRRFWADFCASAGVDIIEPYQVWHFGNTPAMAADLLGLVLAGRKVATASLLAANELEPANAPVPNGYSVVTNFEGEPGCVLQTTAIEHIPFKDVPAEFAVAEGEGDLSLEYWRRVHWDYFSREMAERGFDFNDESIVCCEHFRLLYKR
jgi:uncharacterized protein YhfF